MFQPKFRQPRNTDFQRSSCFWWSET